MKKHFQQTTIEKPVWPNVWRVWVDGDRLGDFPLNARREIEAKAINSGQAFRTEFIGEVLSSGRASKNREVLDQWL
jgi:hypothetical protein